MGSAAAAKRLITRGDFDGIVCAALLREQGQVDEVAFAHPKDMQAGRVPVDDGTITANLPWQPGAHLVFDHHASELRRTDAHAADAGYVNDPDAPSAARVVWNHFGGADAFPGIDPGLLEAVDRADAARYSVEEITDPTGWILIGFVLDARTGLGRFRDFRTDNETLLHRMIDLVRERDADAILMDHDVSERVRVYFEHAAYQRAQLQRCARVEGDVVVLHLRGEDPIHAGNRFTVYTLFPEARVSVHCLRGLPGTTVFALGKSIVDRSSPVDLGALCLEFGGGGHVAAGTCQVPDAEAEATLAGLLERLHAGTR